MSEGLFLIEKHGLYYRPESQGYVGIKERAGRYTFEEAAVIAGPNGPDGPRDGIKVWRENEAPEYSPACFWDVKVEHQAEKIERLREALAALLKKTHEFSHGWNPGADDALMRLQIQAEAALSHNETGEKS